MSGGKSSSTSTTESTTNQYDQRVAASDHGVALGQGASLWIDNTSPEAWKALDGLTEQAGGIADSAFGFAKDIGKQSFDIVNANTAKVLGFLETRSQSEEITLAQQALKLALPVALAAIAVGAFKGKF